jgi:Putative beta-barrel porin-2, OmpL-like. bbp2
MIPIWSTDSKDHGLLAIRQSTGSIPFQTTKDGTMRKDKKFWIAKVRGWAAGLLVATAPFAISSLHAQDAAPTEQACEACEAEAAEEEEGPWRLFNQDRKWKLTGWANAGATFNTQNVTSGFNGPVTFNDQNELQLNQLGMTAEKALDLEDCCWDIGGRVDLMFGSDYIFNQVIGLETHDDGTPHWNSGPNYGLTLNQAYAEVGRGNLSVKLGRFYTPIGYEVVPANANFFYSHAYTMQYGEPFYHVGALATLKQSDELSFLGGVVNGWDAFDREQDTVAGLGGILWNNGDGLSVSLTGILSQDANPFFTSTDDNFTNRFMYSLVVSKEINDCWTYVFQHDNGYQEDGAHNSTIVVNNGDAEWYGVNQYLFRKLNSCWTAGMRLEWFRDDDGARVGAIRAGNPIGTGFAGNFWESAWGLNYKPTTNLTIRSELRYDWYDGINVATPGAGPFDDGTRDDQFIGSADVVYIF